MNFFESESESPAAPAGEGQPESGVEKFISFELGGRLCCVAATSVAEVVHPTAIAELPNSPGWLLGLTAHRGEPVAVIDPAAISKPSAQSLGKAKLIIFRARPNETQFALPIDFLHEMILTPATKNPVHEYLHKGRPVMFVELERLFESFDGGGREIA